MSGVLCLRSIPAGEGEKVTRFFYTALDYLPSDGERWRALARALVDQLSVPQAGLP